ncbi:hypothetical protein ACVDG5_034615 [Mesorhizobium sp. ORM6]
MSGNVLNAENLGESMLIFHAIKTYMYGRADLLFLDGFAAEDHKFESGAGKPILEKLVAEHEIDLALLAVEGGRIPSSMNSETGGGIQRQNGVHYLREGMDR